MHSGGGGIDLLLSLLTSDVYVKFVTDLFKPVFLPTKYVITYIRIPDFVDLVVMSHAAFHDVDAVSIARFHLKNNKIKITYILQNRYMRKKLVLRNVKLVRAPALEYFYNKTLADIKLHSAH